MDISITTEGKKKFLVIKAEIPKDLPSSKSGKNRLLVTTGGNLKSDAMYEDENVTVGLNAYIPAATK